MSESTKTEVLIVKNPMYYKEVSPEAFDALITDGRWIPLVFGAIEHVVQEHFYQLCELDWDYLRDANAESLKTYGNYKTIYYTGLNAEQVAFVQQVADQIEEEVKFGAEETLKSQESAEEE